MRQLSLSEARERGDQGMQAAADRADRTEPGWTDDALQAVALVVRGLPGEFTFETVRHLCETGGYVTEPPDKRAWGAVTRKAIKAKIIAPTGNYAPRLSGNCTPTMLYVQGEA